MARYSLETEAGAVRSIQQFSLGTSISSASTKSNTITAVDVANTIVYPSGGSENATGAYLTSSTNLEETWRHTDTHYWYRTATVVEYYG